MEDDIDDWKLQSQLYKDEGNLLFNNGDLEGSINAYSKAISIDPDNFVLYSNRSAAYLKCNMKSKALKDAEKCVLINKSWVKGYCRLGAAQQALGRIDGAIETLTLGLSIEKDNKALRDALFICENIKKKKSSTYSISSLSSSSGGVAGHTNQENTTTDQLCSFFSSLEEIKVENVKKKEEYASKIMYDERESNKYAKQFLGTGMEQFTRLTGKNHKWKNLNPYYVLSLGIDATDDDIKLRYRKLAALLHPDKICLDTMQSSSSNTNKSCNSNENEILHESIDSISVDKNLAFEYVKNAYKMLCDQSQKSNIIANITMVKEELENEWRNDIEDTNKSTNADNGTSYGFQKELDKRLLRHFANIEYERKRSQNLLQSYNARERETERLLQEDDQAVQEFEAAWKDNGRIEKRVGNWRQFQPSKGKKTR